MQHLWVATKMAQLSAELGAYLGVEPSKLIAPVLKEKFK